MASIKKHIKSNEILLTIICPIHKMAGNLSNLRAWVTETQAYEDLQIVLIHDEGDSETGRELEAFLTLLERRPILVTGRFGSAGAARNQGMNEILGKWTIFWDCDDVPSLAGVRKLISKSESTKKVIIGQYREITFDGSKRTAYVRNAKNHFSLTTNLGIWRMIFKSELLGFRRFPELSMAEDLSFVASLNIAPEFISFESDSVYNYVKGFPNQLSSTKHFDYQNKFALLWAFVSLDSEKTRISKFSLSLISRMILIDFPNQLRDADIQKELGGILRRTPGHFLVICWYCFRHLVAYTVLKLHRYAIKEN